MKISLRKLINEAKDLVNKDKYNSRLNMRIAYSPETKASAVRLAQVGVSTCVLAKELGMSTTTICNWKVLYKDFDLTTDEGFTDFLGMFDGRQMKHKASQSRTNYQETRKVGPKVKVKVEVTVTEEPSILDKLRDELGAHQAAMLHHQAEMTRVGKQIELVRLAEEAGLSVAFK